MVPDGTDTVSVIIYANPEVVTLNDTTICLGENLDILLMALCITTGFRKQLFLYRLQ